MKQPDTVNLVTILGGVGGANNRFLNSLFFQIEPTHYLSLLKTTAFSAVVGALVGGIISIALKEIWLTIKKKQHGFSK